MIPRLGGKAPEQKKKGKREDRKVQRRGSQQPRIRTDTRNEVASQVESWDKKNKCVGMPLGLHGGEDSPCKTDCKYWAFYQDRRTSHLDSSSPKEHGK